MASENALGLSLFNPLNLSPDQKDQAKRNLDIVAGESWSDNALLDITGRLGNVDFPVPSGVRAAEMYFSGVQQTNSDLRGIQLLTRDGTGALVSTATYNCTTSDMSGTKAGSVGTTGYLTVTALTYGAYLTWGKVRFDFVSAGLWVVSGTLAHISGATHALIIVEGAVAISGELAALRLYSTGAKSDPTAYAAGSVAVNWC